MAFSLFNEDRAHGPVTNATRTFYTRKNIQRSYNFLVRFESSHTLDERLRLGLKEFHAISVELPNYDFKKEEYRVGSFIKSFPVLDHNGFEFTMTFEEDDQGTISNMIDVLTRKNINSDGYYKKYSDTVIDNIRIDVTRNDGVLVYAAIFENCFLLKASTAKYDYSSNESIKYEITFNADHFVKYYGKAHTNPNYHPSVMQEADQPDLETE